MIPWKKVNIFEIFGVWHANRGQTKYGIYKVLKNVVDVAFLFSFSFSFFDLIKKYYFIYWLIFRLNEYYYNERNNPIDLNFGPFFILGALGDCINCFWH